MRKLMAEFWNDDRGFTVSTEYVLIATLLVIGLVTGLKNVNEAANIELTDVANAIGAISQTYAFCGGTSQCAFTRGSRFTDTSFTFSWVCFPSFDVQTPAPTCSLP